MKRIFRIFDRSVSKARFGVLLPVCFLTAGQLSDGAPLRSARVSAVIHDVRLLPSNAAPRPAALNDNVGQGTALRTGVESRAELTFADLTVTRLGANTIFSFNEAARELNVTKGAVLVEVPSKAPAAKISTAAVTAGVMGGTALFATGPPVKFMVLEGTGTFYPAGHPERAVTVHGGEMVMMTADGRITQPTKFNVQLVLQTSHLIVDFPALANLPLILQVVNQQLAEESAGTANPLPSKNSEVDVIDVVSQNVTANPSVAAFTAPPSPIGIPSEFGPPSTITSPNPYVITSGTTITTDPTITTNGVTDYGKIWRGTSIDGPLSAFIFGSTSAFDTAIGLDAGAEKVGDSGAVFKFTSLELTGNPTVSTTNGQTVLALVGVNGITSGGPGGTLTFAGISTLLLATQDGSIKLGSEISFSGFQHLVFYARGAGSNLTLASPVSATIHLNLIAEGNIQVSSVDATLTAERIKLFAGGSVTLDGGVMSATANNSSGNVDISAGSQISVTNGLEIDRINGVTSSGLNVSLTAGTNLTAGSSLVVNVDNSVTGNLNDGANISVMTGGNLTINGGGALSLTVANNDGGHIGTGGNISVTTGGDLTAGSINALINNRNGGSIDSGGNMTFNIGGALNIANDASLVISMRNTFGTGGGTVGSDVAVNVSAGNVSTGGGFTTVVSTNGGGNISGSASNTVNVTGDFVTQGDSSVTIQNTGFNSVNPYNFVAGGNITGDTAVTLSARNITSSSTDSGTPVTGLLTNSIEASIYNDGSGHIGGNALVNVTASGDITTPGGAVFAIFNNNFMGFGGGTVVGDATVDVSANNITANALTAQIDNTGGSIGGNAAINTNVSGTANVTNDATFEILGSNGVAKGAAINFNGGNYGVGGTFLSSIDGDGAITFNNVNIHADAVKVGALGNNGILTIGGGAISANTLLKLYAGGSNGIIDFVRNVTLTNQTASVLIAANKVIIENGVVVTIGASGGPASVFTNIANYTGSGGNGSTTGTFGGNGARTSPLSSAPPFGASPSSPTNVTQQPAQSGGQGERTIGNKRMLASNRNNRPVHPPLMPVTNRIINVANSSQLLDLLDNGAPGPGGKITIPASNRTTHSKSSSRINADSRSKADGGIMDAQHVRDNAANPPVLASARSFAP
jgi:hypothetical protein